MKSVIRQGGQYQVVIGNEVSNLFKEFSKMGQFDRSKQAAPAKAEGNVVQRLFGFVPGCMTPLLPAMLGCGMLKVVLTLLTTFCGVSATDSTYVLIYSFADCFFYLLPVFLGLTISHYELPYALVEKYNGWESRELIALYERYCKTIFERYKDKVKLWLTFNEINCGTTPFGALLETGTVQEYEGPTSEIPDNKQERYQALHHQFVASALVVKYAHEHYPQFKVGDMNIFAASYPLTPNPDDVLANQYHSNTMNWF